MEIKTPEQKKAHPIASKIPQSIWESLFYGHLVTDHITLSVPPPPFDFDNLKPRDLDYDPVRAYVLLMAYYPDEPADKLIRYASGVLNLQAKEICVFGIGMGRLDIADRMLTMKPELDKLGEVSDWAFKAAAKNGQLDTLKWVKTKVSTQAVTRMIAENNYKVFRDAAHHGLVMLRWLSDQVPDLKEEMLRANNYEAFSNAAGSGDKDALIGFSQQAPEEKAAMIKGQYFDAFINAARGGHIEVLNWLKEQAPNEVLDMIRISEYRAFREAAGGGHLEVLMWLKEQAPNEVVQMIRQEEFRPFLYAAGGGYLDVLRWFKEQVPTMLDEVLQVSTFAQAIENAAQDDHKETIYWLMQHPAGFFYVGQHAYEYGAKYAGPFFHETLAKLHEEKDAFLLAHPNAVFDFSEDNNERVDLMFYFIMLLILRNDPTLDDELRFLLDIPAVKAIAHLPPRSRIHDEELVSSNALIRYAIMGGNANAAAILLNIEAVRAEAERNNFYQEEARGGLDLRQLARDRESSMTELSTGETLRLQAAISRYQPRIQREGVSVIMNDLREALIKQYRLSPANVEIQGKRIDLPLTYQELQKLREELPLNDTDYECALEAYYKHPAHTAWRYLSKPNPWMHPDASYVYVNEDRTERWSSFEEYQSLISMLYLAATDKETLPTDGHTLESRLNFFISELALIGRSHNWDKTRIRPDGAEEEYDDLEGDRPSCFSGVKRRLFQSVQGHPLLKMLTKDDLLAEIRESALTYFRSVIETESKKGLNEAFINYFVELDEESAKPLRVFNLAEKRINEFKLYLESKYGAGYSQDPAMMKYVLQVLHLDAESKIVSDHYHALKLDGLTGLSDLLNKSCQMLTPKEQFVEEYRKLNQCPAQDAVRLFSQAKAQPESMALEGIFKEVKSGNKEFLNTCVAIGWLKADGTLNESFKEMPEEARVAYASIEVASPAAPTGDLPRRDR